MTKEGTCAVLIRQIHSELEKNANNALRQDDLTLSQVNVLMELDKADGKQMELKQVERSLHVVHCRRDCTTTRAKRICRKLRRCRRQTNKNDSYYLSGTGLLS